ncbi:AMP-binding protein [Brevibacillus brevis]|uniref:AMP-binding protein n=1 Tax=Brevibacillus brevis TaxID=1393 RepID=A0ABY9SWU0_BREBE|nr:AMP-binding protein [Brevibacillus brevis]WNC12292.1 AMP-binding protein [Brevibacillus brevis]
MRQMTLGDLARRGASKFGNRVALVSQNRRYTYEEFNNRCNQFAHSLLESGIQKGDRIAFICYNTNETVEILFGAGKVGIIVLPSNRRLSPVELIRVYKEAEIWS